MSETPTFSRAAVAAPHRLAAEAGRAILGEGGNAIEAMVAMAATITIVYPHMTGIGGDGFWLVRAPNGTVRYIEACGFAGQAATIARYRAREVEAIPQRGPDAVVTLPGAVGGWHLALDLARSLGGKIPLDVLMTDAIGHARDGYPVSRSEGRLKPNQPEALEKAPGFRDTFWIDGKPPEAGAKRMLKPLAATLAYLVHSGLDDFYRGDIGREIARDLQAIGSPVTREDLRRFEAVSRKPLSLRIDDVTLYNAPPPTQGIASLLILGIFARLGVKKPESFAHMHGLIEASKRALAIRDRVCTDFLELRHEIADFLTPAALAREADAIDMRRAARFPIPAAAGDTVWMGAIDASGLAVSYIQSIYWDYGSGCVLPRTGILMQNRGMSFSLDPDAVNPLTPGRRPFHTLNPPLALFDDGRVLSYGSMGGDGQPQFQAQIFTRMQFGMGLMEAIDAPRFLIGKTWGQSSTTLKLEQGFDTGIARALETAGNEIAWSASPHDESFGHAGALSQRVKGPVEAAHDPRSDGGAAGL